MTEVVVYGFEVVDVEHYDAQLFHQTAADFFVQLFLVLDIRLLTLYARQRIGVNFFLRRAQLSDLLLLAPERFLKLPALLLLFVLDDEGMKQTAAEQEAHRIQRHHRVVHLHDDKRRHSRSAEHHCASQTLCRKLVFRLCDEGIHRHHHKQNYLKHKRYIARYSRVIDSVSVNREQDRYEEIDC